MVPRAPSTYFSPNYVVLVTGAGPAYDGANCILQQLRNWEGDFATCTDLCILQLLPGDGQQILVPVQSILAEWRKSNEAASRFPSVRMPVLQPMWDLPQYRQKPRNKVVRLSANAPCLQTGASSALQRASVPPSNGQCTGIQLELQIPHHKHVKRVFIGYIL